MKRLMAVLLLVLLPFLGYGVALVVGGELSKEERKTITAPFPAGGPFPLVSSYTCKSSIGVAIYIEPEDKDVTKRGFEGQVYSGTERLFISIDKGYLYFQTSANAGVELSGTKLKIVEESAENVTAVSVEHTTDGAIVNLFSMNRKTGTAIWTKQRSRGLFGQTGHPDVQSHGMVCRPL